jgi:hypothetical protein
LAKRIRYALAACVVLAAGLVATAASASPPETTTNVVKDSETFVDVLPMCEGGSLYEITIDYNLIEHSTVSDKGEHFTFTQTGTFVAVALEPGALDASGRFTQWGGFNQNPGGAVNGTFTFSVRGAYEDGTRINFHTVDHFNETPTGAQFGFSRCHD